MRAFRHALAALLCLAPAAAGAQRRPAAPTDAMKREVIDSLATALERLYAAPDTGRLIAARVRERLAAGAYRPLDDWQRFARAVTQDLQSVNADTHLWLEAGPPAGGPGGPGPGAALHGVERVERLAGNVGWLRMSGFGGGESALAAVEGALRQLATADAIVLDLRNSRGGSGELANFVISHFVRDSVHSLTVYFRPQDRTTQRYTLARVPGPRRTDVPLYVLTDDVTRSAAEDVPFVLQNLKRAHIVGGRTAGAGRNNAGLPMPHGLSASISISRVMEPATRREWERVGITPDVAVPADSALHVAHRLALDTLVAAATGARRRELELTREVVLAEQAGRRLPEATLRRWAGTYEGGQSLAVHDGRLVYQPRVAQPRVVLVPLGDTRFGSGATRYEIVQANGRPSLRITTPDGTSTTYAREDAGERR